MRDLNKLMLDQYKPPEIEFDCGRCRHRHGHFTVAALKAKFGNQRLDVLARMVARASTSIHGPCALADDPHAKLCYARPIEPDPITWATIMDAEKGGWLAHLHCHRRHASMKSVKSCTEVTPLPVMVLKALYGWDAKLYGLERRFRCPYCGTPAVEISWEIPAEAPPPGGSTQQEAPEPVRLRPTGAQLGRQRFRVIEGEPRRRRGGH